MNNLESALQAISDSQCDDLTKAKARGLLRGYHARWESPDWKSLATEEQFLLPIVNPESGRESRTFRYAGRRDGLIEYVPSGKLWLREAKTCSEDIENPDAPYWRRLAIDAQVSMYVLSQWQEGRKVDGTLYDVIRKPGIRPKEMSKSDRQHVVANGWYFSQRVSPETRNAITAGMERENAELFELRLTADCYARPQNYFARRSIPRMDSDLLEFARELWQISNEVRETRLSGRWYRNSGSCMQWGRPCEYLGVCSGIEKLEVGDKWKAKEWIHNELEPSIEFVAPPGVSNGGRSLLTHSNLSTFKSCRRKFYYRHELGIERADEEDSESLTFGKLWHKAMEAWWSNESDLEISA